MSSKFSNEEITKYLEDIFPQIKNKFKVIKLENKFSEVQLRSKVSNLRPGNTISGPAMFELADIAFFVSVINLTGSGSLAVTTNVSINFIKKPPFKDLLGISRIRKAGRRLLVGDVDIMSTNREELYAQALMTYSVPRENSDNKL